MKLTRRDFFWGGNALVLAGAAFAGLCAVCAAFEFFSIREEGYVSWSPIAMCQGAPLSHFEQVHPGALRFHRAARSVAGRVGASVILLLGSLAWASVMRSSIRPAWKILATAGFAEAWLLILNVPVSAIEAFHHVGYGMDCNEQPFQALMTLHIFASPVLLYVGLLTSLAIRSARPVHDGPVV